MHWQIINLAKVSRYTVVSSTVGVSDIFGGVVNANGLHLWELESVSSLLVEIPWVELVVWKSFTFLSCSVVAVSRISTSLHSISCLTCQACSATADLSNAASLQFLYIRLAPKGCRMNRDDGRELSLVWIRTIANALKKKFIYKPRPPRELRPRDNRPLPRVRWWATATSPAPIQSTLPKAPPPIVRGPTYKSLSSCEDPLHLPLHLKSNEAQCQSPLHWPRKWKLSQADDLISRMKVSNTEGRSACVSSRYYY